MEKEIYKEHRIDIWILAPVILLIVFSLGVVYSASSDYAMSRFGDSNYLFKQHLTKVAMSVVLIFIFAKIDYRVYYDIGKYLIWGSILLLIALFIIGVTVKNVNRWISLGPIRFQPSDLAKFTIIIYLSRLLVRKKNHLTELYKGYLPLVFFIIVVSGLVALQPNFSTSIIIFGSSILLLLTSPVKLKHIIITLISILPLGILFIMTKSYIRARIENYADFTSGGSAQHQLNQAIIGLGNGGFFGTGGGYSVQKQFFLPESYGDFIFSIVGEEYGFIGTVFVILMFSMLLIRGYQVSKNINDDFGKYLSFGITTILIAYAVVNTSVSTGIFPTTGVPIPFISYGGTALIVNSVAVGILLNISMYRNGIYDKNSDI
ncbi:MAG: FtsW/RodA/SpoVE family cell cycle protein [Ignavibacteriae bacterium]|nr:FtsW/RodA/SpoVE family cell cycle protein [Ignavibacteriota bacterium]